VLRDVLARNGIGNEHVTYAAVGTGAERLAALNTGACAATLLNAPLCLAAEMQGNTRLLRVRNVFGSYQGIVGTARRTWAAANRTVLESFIRAFHESLTWLRDPQNKMAACTLLVERLPAIGSAVDRAYNELITESGLTPNLRINRHGVARVLELRERYQHRTGALGTLDHYVDESFWRNAVSG
jgi:ABC-type nitrate/sulfonate/bicarbonate transport system substrate-binding protein